MSNKNKKSRLEPNIEGAVKAAYRLGMMEGEKSGISKGQKLAEEYLEERIKAVCKTNKNLLEEIFRLDWSAPVTGVFVPYPYAEKLCRKMKEKGMPGHASRLRYYINRANPIDIEAAMAIIEEMTKLHRDGENE